MNDQVLQEKFEKWHKTTSQYKKYKLSHKKSHDGHYYDNRTTWAYIAFKGGYTAAENERKTHE
ncbi:hypothetical protein [Neisseria dumasiana]|uniref:Uncharacterized protein n=1 Tax=Neisseria dumasiana TaxID=1931275 RepID=A0A1X3DI03_9NEIS|nr:hypothetical protein [Neisseria dumasiana]OSI20434.1 hypothetical protein BV912_07640 [Neisseria dumasiana]